MAKLITKNGKLNAIGEDLILPAAKGMGRVLVGEKEAKKLNVISLSDNTVKHRIGYMTEDVLKQLTSRIKTSPFYAFQIEESTDIASFGNFARFYQIFVLKTFTVTHYSRNHL